MVPFAIICRYFISELIPNISIWHMVRQTTKAKNNHISMLWHIKANIWKPFWYEIIYKILIIVPRRLYKAKDIYSLFWFFYSLLRMKASSIKTRYQSADMTFYKYDVSFPFSSSHCFSQCSVCFQPMFAWFLLSNKLF